MNTKSTKNKIFSVRDLILILVIISVSVAVYAVFPRQTGSTAVIKCGGETVETVDLKTAKNEKREVCGTVIEIRDGEIGFVKSDCPDKTCVKTGFISKKGEKAVCMPNRVTIEIVDRDVQAVVY